jgi:hypothetical protein
MEDLQKSKITREENPNFPLGDLGVVSGKHGELLREILLKH